ncbi:CCA tRNA nucleotidyltransferase, partial [Anaerostipes hadrus]|nr:CCA tRNA nucleotidyltransferase [Anaerostipes hadrus]
MLPPFQTALPIIRTLEDAGFKAFFVGGSIRDSLLGRPVHDVDIATSAKPEEVKALFTHTVDIGIEHG